MRKTISIKDHLITSGQLLNKSHIARFRQPSLVAPIAEPAQVRAEARAAQVLN